MNKISNLKIILILLSIFNLNLNNISCKKKDKDSDIDEEINTETCVNIEGEQVDWYIILLFPQNSSQENKLSYGYFDSKSEKMEFYLYDKDTFPPLFFTKDLDKKKKTNYIFWNDDKTTENLKDEAPISKAHSKGSLIYNSQSGKFLMHSLPRFPRRSDDDKIISELPENAGIYGQHFLCLSLQGIEAANMIENLSIINPSIVHKHGLKDLVGYNSEIIEKFLSEKIDKKRENNIQKTIKTKEGFELDLFAKSNLSTDLPFEKIIPELYESNVFVETWSKPEMIPNLCTNKFKIRNIEQLKFSNFIYNKTKEHSKWAVMENKPISCFSDLNRIESQKKRGGMTICIKLEKLAKILRNGIVEYDKCKNDTKKFNLNLKFLE